MLYIRLCTKFSICALIFTRRFGPVQHTSHMREAPCTVVLSKVPPHKQLVWPLQGCPTAVTGSRGRLVDGCLEVQEGCSWSVLQFLQFFRFLCSKRFSGVVKSPLQSHHQLPGGKGRCDSHICANCVGVPSTCMNSCSCQRR